MSSEALVIAADSVSFLVGVTCLVQPVPVKKLAVAAIFAEISCIPADKVLRLLTGPGVNVRVVFSSSLPLSVRLSDFMQDFRAFNISGSISDLYLS